MLRNNNYDYNKYDNNNNISCSCNLIPSQPLPCVGRVLNFIEFYKQRHNVAAFLEVCQTTPLMGGAIHYKDSYSLEEIEYFLFVSNIY